MRLAADQLLELGARDGTEAHAIADENPILKMADALAWSVSVVALLIGLIYTLPNFFGEAPADIAPDASFANAIVYLGIPVVLTPANAGGAITSSSGGATLPTVGARLGSGLAGQARLYI